MTGPFYFPRPPRPPGNPQPVPTFQALTRWLTPWRTIRRLEADNQRLREQAVVKAAINQELSNLTESRRLKIEALAGPAYRLRNCPTHGQQPPNAWGCPECVRELRGELATAREALRRLVRYYAGQDYDSEVVRGVYLWATDNGMTGPLPPLPDHIAKREQPATEDQAMSTLPETTLARLRQRQESATPPAPELLEANFRAWYKEARGSLYCGAMPLCDAIEWAQHLLQQATPQALVPPAAPATPTPAPAMTYQQRAVVDVLDERRHQDDMWGISNHDPTTWMAILTEAVGKTAQATVQQRFNYPRGTKAWIRIKAVHVAAVALAFIECLDRSQQTAIPLPDHMVNYQPTTTEDQPTAEDQL